MAILNGPPSDATIVAFRGVIDYWHQWGQWYARGWPREKRMPRTALEIAGSSRFTAATRGTSVAMLTLRPVYLSGMEGVGVTWIDRQRALALGKPWDSIA